MSDAIETEPDTSRPARDDVLSEQDLVDEGDIAADYIEDLLDITDIDGDIDIDAGPPSEDEEEEDDTELIDESESEAAPAAID